jgi:serine/threonine protein phosphatase 1
MRTVVVGDIHGCYQELMRLLETVNLSADDCLISLGDIVDRGPESVKVYDFLKKRPNTIVLMGNHERKHLRQTLSYSQEIVKLQFGDRYPEFLAWVQNLPYYYETETAIFVHAGVEDRIPLAAQREEVLCGCNAGVRYLEKQYGSAYWTQQYTGEKPIIFGHHVVEKDPLIIQQRLYGIDTGACHGGRLTALILPGFDLAQVQSQRNYWQEEIVKWQGPVMEAKPWHTYSWAKIKAMCAETRRSSNPKLVAFAMQKEQWMNRLLGLAPVVIAKIEEQLATLTAVYGVDGFQQQTSHLSYGSLLHTAKAGPLTLDVLQQSLPTPGQWIQVMADLDIQW